MGNRRREEPFPHPFTPSMPKRFKKLPVLLAIVVVVVALAISAFGFFGGEKASPYRVEPVRKAPFSLAIKATGTLQPDEVVDVGAQAAGQILSLGTDAKGAPLDFGSRVDEGMILAKIDEVLSAADLASARAQLQQAKAARATAAANVLQSKARLTLASNDWERAKITGPAGAISKSQSDSYRSAYDVAAAEVAVAEAAVERADADIVQARAALDRAERNLGFCIIRSPVKGVIIDRKVSAGQTIVSNFSTPTLFLIAKDLAHMRVLVPVNEADIGRVKSGMPVSFTVDTFPGREFSGKVVRTRLNATLTQNVVTYIVEVSVDNSDGTLLPYLTANMTFETDRLADALQVPAAALSWAPASEKARPGEDAVSHAKAKPRVWVLRDDNPVPVEVTAGLTDGVTTVVTGSDLKENDRVVVGETADAKGDEMPPPRKGSR